MQQLVIKDGLVVATHAPEQRLHGVYGVYPGCEILLWGDLEVYSGDPDPRSDEEKRNNYADLRRMSYPRIEDQLDMIYWDAVNDTDDWIMAIHKVKTKIPKPEKSHATRD